MGKIGPTEWLIILAILLLLFGAAKLPAIGRGLGEGIRNFRKSLRSGAEDDEESSAKRDRKEM